jgi:hypothetical protein
LAVVHHLVVDLAEASVVDLAAADFLVEVQVEVGRFSNQLAVFSVQFKNF